MKLTSGDYRKILGGLLIGCALLSDKDETRLGLGVLGAACLFPEETKLLANAVKKENEKCTNKDKVQPKVDVRQNNVLIQDAILIEDVGLIRRTVRLGKSQLSSFWRKVY